MDLFFFQNHFVCEVHYTLETVSHHKPSFVREYSATCHIANFPFGVSNVIKQCLLCFLYLMYDLFISMSASANKLKPTFPPCSHGKRLLRNHDAKKTQCEHSGVVLAYEQKSQAPGKASGIRFASHRVLVHPLHSRPEPQTWALYT